MHGEASLRSERDVQIAFSSRIQAAGAEGLQNGICFFKVSSLLDENSRLAETLADPAGQVEAKQKLVKSIFAGSNIEKLVLEILDKIVSLSWSAPEDIADIVEDLGVSCILAASDAAGQTDEVATQLADINSAILNHPIVRQHLSDTHVSSETRVQFWRNLFADAHLNQYTVVLAEHATTDLRGRKYVSAIEWLIKKISEHKNRYVVQITCAAHLTQEQQNRLINIYTRKLNHSVHLDITVDPTVLGGMRIQCGADVTDTTVVAQLENLRKALR